MRIERPLIFLDLNILDIFYVFYLYFSFRLENDKLKQQLKKKDEEVIQTRATLERFANAVSNFSLNLYFSLSVFY